MLADTALREAGFDRSAHAPRKTLREHLRAATSDAHARLDEQFAALDLQRIDDYRTFLEASAAALLPLEDALEAARVDLLFPDWPQRLRRGAILRDLAHVGGVARPIAPPTPFGSGETLGVMYVLEGSRLGAAVLLKTVMRSADPIVRESTGYLRHGEGLRLWRGFLAALERHGTRVGAAEAALEGAHRAFDLFAQAADRALGAERIGA